MKNLFLTLALFCFSSFAFAQNNPYQLSSHILDVSQGMPATGVTIKLEKQNEFTQAWTKIDEKITDSNGRITNFLPGVKNTGIFRLTYFTKEYFSRTKTDSFYPFIEVVFEIKDENHYHVPITLSAYGYATYRGN